MGYELEAKSTLKLGKAAEAQWTLKADRTKRKLDRQWEKQKKAH